MAAQTTSTVRVARSSAARVGHCTLRHSAQTEARNPVRDTSDEAGVLSVDSFIRATVHAPRCRALALRADEPQRNDVRCTVHVPHPPHSPRRSAWG